MSDLQMVNLTLRVLSKPDTEHLPTIFKTLGLDYDERVLPSIGNEVLKAVVVGGGQRGGGGPWGGGGAEGK